MHASIIHRQTEILICPYNICCTWILVLKTLKYAVPWYNVTIIPIMGISDFPWELLLVSMFHANFMQYLPWGLLLPVTYDTAIYVFAIQYVWCCKQVRNINLCLFDFGENWIKATISIESTYMIFIKWLCKS